MSMSEKRYRIAWKSRNPDDTVWMWLRDASGAVREFTTELEVKSVHSYHVGMHRGSWFYMISSDASGAFHLPGSETQSEEFRDRCSQCEAGIPHDECDAPSGIDVEPQGVQPVELVRVGTWLLPQTYGQKYDHFTQTKMPSRRGVSIALYAAADDVAHQYDPPGDKSGEMLAVATPPPPPPAAGGVDVDRLQVYLTRSIVSGNKLIAGLSVVDFDALLAELRSLRQQVAEKDAEISNLRNSIGRIAWDRRPGLPDVPVLQDRYDKMCETIAELQRREKVLIQIVREEWAQPGDDDEDELNAQIDDRLQKGATET